MMRSTAMTTTTTKTALLLISICIAQVFQISLAFSNNNHHNNNHHHHHHHHHRTSPAPMAFSHSQWRHGSTSTIVMPDRAAARAAPTMVTRVESPLFMLRNMDGHRRLQQQQRQHQQRRRRHGRSTSSLHAHAHTSAIFSPAALAAVVKTLFQSQGNVPIWLAFSFNALLFGLLTRKLQNVLTMPSGYVHALALGTMLWTTLGWRGWSTCVVYLILGSAVTKIKFQEKQSLGIAEGRDGRRGPENVWGSAATALICAICSTCRPSFLGIPSHLYRLGFVASLSTKLADTFASEIGKAYGKTTFLITTFERVKPGTEGAVSAEGTAAAAVGGLLLSLYGYFVGLITLRQVPLSTIAAFLGTNAESVLGATLQGKDNLKWVTNELVNFFNTLIGATIAVSAGMLL